MKPSFQRSFDNAQLVGVISGRSSRLPHWPTALRRVAKCFDEAGVSGYSVLPVIAGRVAPFSSTPPLDVIETERELILELALPGIDRNDVRIEIQGDALHVSGMRSPERPAEREGRIYHHAEIPRGVFHRLVPLPYAVGEPRIEAELGLIRIRLPRRIKTAPAQA